jgi:hypothetical protein
MRTCLISLLLLCATGCKEKPKVSFETAEEARKIARENSGALAREWRASLNLSDYDLVLRGDSTITNDCPQGDGWASIDMLNPTTNHMLKLKCSTVSQGMGCMTDEDFKKRAEYANQDGKCNPEIPFPLPKIFN